MGFMTRRTSKHERLPGRVKRRSSFSAREAEEKLLQKLHSNFTSVRRAFRAIDADHSGVISDGNMRGILKRFNINMEEREFSKLMRKWDSIKADGEIDYEEFRAKFGKHIAFSQTSTYIGEDGKGRRCVRKRVTTPPREYVGAATAERQILEKLGVNFRSVRKAFRSIDTDHSGIITPQKFHAALTRFNIFVTPQVLKEVVARFDMGDCDGVIDFEEFRQRFGRHIAGSSAFQLPDRGAGGGVSGLPNAAADESGRREGRRSNPRRAPRLASTDEGGLEDAWYRNFYRSLGKRPKTTHVPAARRRPKSRQAKARPEERFSRSDDATIAADAEAKVPRERFPSPPGSEFVAIRGAPRLKLRVGPPLCVGRDDRAADDIAQAIDTARDDRNRRCSLPSPTRVRLTAAAGSAIRRQSLQDLRSRPRVSLQEGARSPDQTVSDGLDRVLRGPLGHKALLSRFGIQGSQIPKFRAQTSRRASTSRRRALVVSPVRSNSPSGGRERSLPNI
jgi:Ca2+-binding EF-hand superfamily protein